MSAPCPGVVRATAHPSTGGGLRPALFLDRDGVVNVDHGYVHAAEQTRFVDGIFALCTQARTAGHLLVVVTNQAGIARGLYTEATFRDYTHWLHDEFAARGVPLAATYYCPHHPVAGLGEYLLDCPCRKPRPGMLLQARDDLGIDMARSLLVGDKDSDIAAARAAGVGRAVRVDGGMLGPALRALAGEAVGTDDA